MPNSTICCLGDPDLDAITEAHIRGAIVFRLPFRLRLGQFYRFSYDDRTELFFRNRVLVPEGEDAHDVLMKRGKAWGPPRGFGMRWDPLFTDGMVVYRATEVDPPTLKNLAEAVRKDTPGPRIAQAHTVVEYVNSFVVAYHHMSNDLFGGAPIKRLSSHEFLGGVVWEITLICEPTLTLDEPAAMSLFNTSSSQMIIQDGTPITYQHLDDLPLETICGLQEHLRRHGEYIFYEFALDAKSRMVSGDYVAALLYSVIALEGAHATLVGIALSERFAWISDPDDRAKAVEEHSSTLLREAGLSVLIKLSPVLFMTPDARPTQEELNAAGSAITLRNEIMHSLRRKGRYKLRNRTTGDLLQGYSAALAVYKKLVADIERRDK